MVGSSFRSPQKKQKKMHLFRNSQSHLEKPILIGNSKFSDSPWAVSFFYNVGQWQKKNKSKKEKIKSIIETIACVISVQV